MQIELSIDIYTWKKLEHRAAEEGRTAEELAADVLEKEAEREYEKVFARKVEATRMKSAAPAVSLRRARGVEATQSAARSRATLRRVRRVEATHLEA